MSTKRKFIESHWLTFAVKGVLSIVAGLCLMFSPSQDANHLIQIVGWTMLGLGIIEIANVVYRSRRQHNFGFPLFLGFLEGGIAVALLYTVDKTASLATLLPIRITILAIYFLLASIVTVIMGFCSFDSMTDRFMWVVNGMLGCVLSFVIFAGGTLGDVAHIMLFGTYLMVNGLTDLFYGIHSKDELQELHAERASKRLLAKKSKKGSRK